MQCPKCKAAMEDVTFADITVERCSGCHGLWFDSSKVEKLVAIKGADAIDTGGSEEGKKYNEISKISCPVCQTPMIRMVELDHPHIWYESCKVCKGVFLDAGEFRDLAHPGLVGWFKDHFLIKERK
jgi:Zn-finger nucleic acid-binding protein